MLYYIILYCDILGRRRGPGHRLPGPERGDRVSTEATFGPGALSTFSCTPKRIPKGTFLKGHFCAYPR